mmetsp:Transcript_26737/g.37633  ORF Transcript_26737/g.37633 Transcript_26737/m.37633 type:complete len:344 (-) Transcript_26737:85-1116(-)
MKQLTTLVILLLCCHATKCFTCSNEEDCNNHGVCKKGKCLCETSFIPPDCTYFPYKIGVPYTCFYYPMTIAFFCLWIFTSYRLFQFSKDIRRWKYEFGVRHIAIILLWFGLLARVIFNGVNLDMNWKRNSTGFYPFLLQAFYPFALSAFSCELVVWMELYSTTTLHNIERLPRYRKWLIIFNVVMFPTLQILRLIATLQPTLRVLDWIWMFLLAVFVLVITGGFVLVGYLLLRKIRAMKALTGQEQQRTAFVKLTATLMAQTAIIIITCALFVAAGIGWNDAKAIFAGTVLLRLAEVIGVIFILVIIKPPAKQQQMSHASTHAVKAQSPENSIGLNISESETL